jgi:dipeptidyl aminopeptidase/acylaminoacyl peptidase
MHYISYTPQRPQHFSQPYALPGDSIIPYPGFHVITLAVDMTTDGAGMQSGPSASDVVQDPQVRVVSNVAPEVEPRPAQLSFGGSGPDSTWASTSDKVYVTYFTRASKKVFLAEIDASTGDHRVLAADSSPTWVDLSQLAPASWYVSRDGENVIWWSERDGWAHLWRYDQSGNVKNQITSGPWTVATVVHVDEEQQTVYFTGRGREPGRNLYYAHLYRVNFDGSGLQLITPEDADHTISVSPSGRFFVDSYSRIEAPPVTVLRGFPDGRVVRTLEEADISRLEESGWTPAEVFTAKARDGVTDLYGVIYFPPEIDSTKQYPIISHIYPGPFIGSVGRWTFKGGGEDHALAQLGFVVVQIDHMGTSLRNVAFHHNYFGFFGDNGLPDHITVIKQLAARYPFIDIDRVGIFGHSGGGFASTDAMLRHPDFFKVAVSGAGNHDNRSYNIGWAEKYMGELERDSVRSTDNFATSANQTMAANLKGKLLLMHGDMDDNVHPANTIQVVNELIKANRDFDLIIAPDRAHGLNEPYFIRRRWDYFVRHLMGAEPPKEYEIKRPEN